MSDNRIAWPGNDRKPFSANLPVGIVKARPQVYTAMRIVIFPTKESHMVQQICPNCDAGNALENRFCGQCGARLGEGALARRPVSDLMVGVGRLLPAESLQQVGRAVAVSLAALAAETALSWVRRRLSVVDKTPAARSTSTALVGPLPQPTARRTVTTIISQRVVRIWQIEE
ncbi:MAG: zinc-ribbon domain-containing protein [Acidobacteriota bacterium]